MRDKRKAAAVITEQHRIPTKVTATEEETENVSCEGSDNDETAVLIKEPKKKSKVRSKKAERLPLLGHSANAHSDRESLTSARVATDFHPSDEEICRIFSEQYGSTGGEDFAACLIEAIRAINRGINPERIPQGSSGSYFVKNLKGEVIGVFKPKNEEPYGSLNPKWVKWAHKLLCPCFFGRSCLVPNQGYLSEAGASLVDQKLGLNVVPRTAIVALAAPTFHYGRIDRTVTSTKEQISRNYPDLGRHFKRIGLPPKRGSFQLFVRGYKDAKYWLDQWEQSPEKALPKPSQRELQLQFEKMVILDYIIRNTDRGNENWLICYTPPTTKAKEGNGLQRRRSSSSSLGELKRSDSLTKLKELLGNEPAKFTENGKIVDIHEPVTYESEESIGVRLSVDNNWEDIEMPHVKIAAIDHGLAFPFKHPDQWRAYPFQWAKLSMAQIPFSEEIIHKMLPVLEKSEFLRELGNDLRNIFKTDKGFDKKTFNKQLSVVYGQIFNLREALRERKTPAQLVQMTPLYIIEMKKNVFKQKVHTRSPFFSCC
ncbi:hypothetical protein niasHT_005675 [Heterodera trifolii]|uniref:Phosphatidylinositol 4-kinase type 2 n=1 Tax=Heterodera trifolii TaxID=157864 RepID=A0ABD2M808_9BILA